MSSQPSRFVTSGVPSGAHSVPSLRQIRPTTSSSAAVLQAGGNGIGVALGDVGFDRRDVAHARFLLQGLRIASHASEREPFRK